MKQVIFSISLIVLCFKLITNAGEQKRDHIQGTTTTEIFTLDSALNLPDRVVKLPVGDNVYFSETLCLHALNDLKRLGILTLVRMNGRGKDTGCLKLEDEAELSGNQGIRMHYYNIDGGDDIANIVKAMADGNTWVHCKHGAHRAALAAGCFMISKGVTYQEAVEVIGWTKGKHPIITNPDYAKYVAILHQWADQYYLSSKQELI